MGLGVTALHAAAIGVHGATPASSDPVRARHQLVMAVRKNQVTKTKYLLETMSKDLLTCAKGPGAQALEMAAHRDNVAMVARLIDGGVDVNARSTQFSSAAETAAFFEKEKVFYAMLKRGLDVEQNFVRETLQHKARLGAEASARMLVAIEESNNAVKAT